MKATSYELSVIAYYLSEYDMKAVKELGFRTRQEAFNEISIIMGRENNYLKLRRDEFDVLTSSNRKGWCNRPVTQDVQKLFENLSVKTYDEITREVQNIISCAKIDTQSENLYVEKVNTSISSEKGKKIIRYEPKPISTQKQGEYIFYKRDPGIAINAIKNADYKCEYCSEHQTFIRKANGMPYTEPHHLVPMRAQKDFSVSLDVENNIVSLCSNCHNLIHYGKGAEILLKKIYNEREQLLQRAGIVITFEELMNYYK